MKKYQKGFVGIAVAIVIALILGGGGAYYYNKTKEAKKDATTEENILQGNSVNTSNDLDTGEPQASNYSTSVTSDWKTYRNEKYGFEFQYPKSYGSFEENTTYPYVGGLAKVKSIFNSQANIKNSKYFLWISVTPINTYKFSNTGGETISYDLINNKCIGDIVKNLEINNNYLFQDSKGCYIGEGDGLGGATGYIIPNIKSQQIVEIIIPWSEGGLSPDEALRDLNNILSNFKFTQTNSETSNKTQCTPNSYIVSEPQYKDKYSLFDSHIDPQALIFCDANGKKIILIEGLLKLPVFAEIYKNNKVALFKLAQPKNADTLFLYTSIPETDAGIGKVYRFNPTDLSFTSLKIVVEGYRVGTLSPEQDKYVHTRDSEIYICNLLLDNCEKVLTLLPGEHLNSVPDLSSLPETTVKWRDNSSIEYNVYFSEVGTDGLRKLKEIRNLKI